MSHKQVFFRSEARERILRGVTALADAVRVTLGPKSRCVLIEKTFGLPIVCNDGVTIAKEMELKDRVENLGAQMIRQAAERTSDAVGDGTCRPPGTCASSSRPCRLKPAGSRCAPARSA